MSSDLGFVSSSRVRRQVIFAAFSRALITGKSKRSISKMRERKKGDCPREWPTGLPVRFPTEEIKIGQEVVRTASTLQTGDELQEDAVYAITQTDFLPLRITWMLLALVQEQRLHVVLVDGRTRQIKVSVAQGFQHRETLLPTTTLSMVYQ